MTGDEGWAFLTGVVLAMGLFVLGPMAFDRSGEANQKCQALGYSAGHYEREAGLVCEQWIPAALAKASVPPAAKEQP